MFFQFLEQIPVEPPGIDDGSAAALLDEAEEILNSAGARIKAEVDLEREQGGRRRGIKGLFRRKR